MPEVVGRRGQSALQPSVPSSGSSSVRRAARRSGRPAIWLISLLSLLPVLLAACSLDNATGPTLAKNQTFTWPYFGSANLQRDEVLDPATITAAEDLGTLDMIYAGLVTQSPTTLTVQPDAATWDVDPTTGTAYTFHLKHNLHFSDGTPLTASDYAYSIDRALDPNLCTVYDAKTYGATGTCAPISGTYLSMILGAQDRLNGAIATVIGTGDDAKHGVDVLDPYTLRIRLATPAPYFMEALTYPTAFPVERALVQKYPGGLWVDHLDEGGCSGPFKIVSYGSGKELKLVPNTSWEAAYQQQLSITEVDRPAFASEDDEYARYRAGQFDFTDIPAGDYSLASTQDDFHEVATLQTLYFGLNQDKPPFDNVLVRRAFELALNKQILVDRILNGGAIPTNHLIPLGMPGFNAALVIPPPDGTQTLTGNQTGAARLLQQALQQCTGTVTPAPDFCPYIDHKAQSQEIDVVYNSDRATEHDVTTAAASTWAQVLNLNVKAVPSNLPATDYFGNLIISPTHPICPYQAWNVTWVADYPDPEDWTSLQFSHNPRSPFNAVDEHSTTLDALMQAADRDLNPTDRMAKYQQIEQDLVNDVAWLPYAQGKVFWRVRSWVRGFGLDAQLTMTDLSWPRVFITQH